MIKITTDDNILYIKLEGDIESGAFEKAVEHEADYVISEYGKIRGMLIDASDMNGNEGLPELLEEYEFIKKHKEDIYRIALLGDSTLEKILTPIADLLLDPVIKRFDPGQKDVADAWLKENVFTRGQ